MVAAIRKMDERITVQKTAALDRDEGKEVSLGTSKINYLDPRITYVPSSFARSSSVADSGPHPRSFAWCKKHGVPVNKLLSRTLVEKCVLAVRLPSSSLTSFSRSPSQVHLGGGGGGGLRLVKSSSRLAAPSHFDVDSPVRRRGRSRSRVVVFIFPYPHPIPIACMERIVVIVESFSRFDESGRMPYVSVVTKKEGRIEGEEGNKECGDSRRNRRGEE